MKKRIFWALVAGVAACIAHAGEVTFDMAKAAANEWTARNAQFGAGGEATNVVSICDTNVAKTVLFHQVSMSGGGCVIVAPVTEIEPVVMALERDPGNLNEGRLKHHPLRGMLSIDMRRRLRFLNLYEENPSSRRLAASASSGADAAGDSEEVAAEKAAVRKEWAEQQETKWGSLLSTSRRKSRRLAVDETKGVTDKDMKMMMVVPGFEQGGPLTHWNQGYYTQRPYIYNLYTPNNSVCGCVATALSAMIQYFKVKKGPEEKSNTCTVDGASNTYPTKGGDYDWSILPKEYGGESDGAITDEGRDLLGRVAYDAGVAVGMNWTLESSGALEQTIAMALRDFFGFTEARCVNNPTQGQYEKLIYAQCRSGAPVGLGIEAHSVLAVGYGKDVDGVERVRVFMGWGGSGDGWYALPYIDTKSTVGGGSYLSTVVDCVITMVGYENDSVVPVCGELLPKIDAEVTVGANFSDGGVVTKANKDGFFGVRVSASEARKCEGLVEITCEGKSGSVSVGNAPASRTETYNGIPHKYINTGSEICNWVPDSILFPLLNSEVALSFADARKKSIDKNKPIFAFSGTWGEDATEAAWNYVYGLDGSDASFTNKYIVLCTPYSLSNVTESDGNPSFAVYSGRAIDPNRMWSHYNGRLDYWTIGNSIYTNDVGFVNSPVTNDFRVSSATDTVSGGVVDSYVTGEFITNAVIKVLQDGSVAFDKATADITLTVASNCPEDIGVPSPYAYGTWKESISNGTFIVETVPEFATNTAGNVEFKCVGYTLYDGNDIVTTTNEFFGTRYIETYTNVVWHDEGTTAKFSVTKDDNRILVWQWETNKVFITTKVVLVPGYREGGGTITPGTGWYKVGEEVTFVARPAAAETGRYYYFLGWNIDANWVAGNVYDLTVESPTEIKATFSYKKDKSELEKAEGTFTLAVTNVSISTETDVSSAPKTLVGGSALNRSTVTLPCVGTDASLSTNEFANAKGKWRCYGWMLTEGTNLLDFASSPLVVGLSQEKDSNVVLTWLWKRTGGTNDEVEVQTEFPIEWDKENGWTNLYEGVQIDLVSTNQLKSAGLTVTVPDGWNYTIVTNGTNVAVVLHCDEAALRKTVTESCKLTIFPKTGDSETYTVEAEVKPVLGFMYALESSDDFTHWPLELKSEKQATDDNLTTDSCLPLSIDVDPSETGEKRFYRVRAYAPKDPNKTKY